MRVSIDLQGPDPTNHRQLFSGPCQEGSSFGRTVFGSVEYEETRRGPCRWSVCLAPLGGELTGSTEVYQPERYTCIHSQHTRILWCACCMNPSRRQQLIASPKLIRRHLSWLDICWPALTPSTGGDLTKVEVTPGKLVPLFYPQCGTKHNNK